MPSFPCTYCEQPIDADDRLAGCMIVCGHCGRNVMAPQGTASYWLAPSQPPSTLRAARVKIVVSTLTFALLGAFALGLLTFSLVWFFSLRMIGLGTADAVMAGWIAAGLGGFFVGLLTWRVMRE